MQDGLSQVAGDVVVVADADVWCDGLADAVAEVEQGTPWAVPHHIVHRLSEDATASVFAGASWREQPLCQRPYPGLLGGGFVVVPGEVIPSIPPDPRFTGWGLPGQEDECWAMALTALLGEPHRGQADLIHFWHPPQQRWTRRRGSRESWELRKRYREASADPIAMNDLIEEIRVPSPPAQYPLHDHAPVVV